MELAVYFLLFVSCLISLRWIFQDVPVDFDIYKQKFTKELLLTGGLNEKIEWEGIEFVKHDLWGVIVTIHAKVNKYCDYDSGNLWSRVLGSIIDDPYMQKHGDQFDYYLFNFPHERRYIRIWRSVRKSLGI